MAVARLQQALLDLGLALPQSTRIGGRPDGLFGYETAGMLASFQRDHALYVDGCAGRQTMACVDRQLPLVGVDPQVAESGVDGPIGVAEMGISERVERTLEKSLTQLPWEARSSVVARLNPCSLAVMAEQLFDWTHSSRLGRVADILVVAVELLPTGVVALEVAHELWGFGIGVTRGDSEGELDLAAQHFAAGVEVGGAAAVLAILENDDVEQVRQKRMRALPQEGVQIEGYTLSASRGARSWQSQNRSRKAGPRASGVEATKALSGTRD